MRTSHNLELQPFAAYDVMQALARGGVWAGILAILFAITATAAVVDRVAVVVGKIVITESEVLQEVRLTEFLNNQPLDFGPEPRRAAAERLVDQQLIRTEMEIGHYPAPSAAESDAVVRKFRQEHYLSINEFKAALERYGITEDQLKQHLVWQLEAIHFTDLRFRMGAPVPAATTSSGADRRETASKATAPANTQPAAEPAANTVDQQMDAWLKEARGQTRIQFKKEAFQ